MAADLNRVALVGRLTRDIELRHTAGGTPVGNIRLAFTSRQKINGDWQDVSNYIDVVVFGAMAENAAKYLEKGRRVGVDGRLSWREWQAQDGSKRQNIEVVAETLQYLDSNPNGNGANQSQPSSDPLPVGEPVDRPDPAEAAERNTERMLAGDSSVPF